MYMDEGLDTGDILLQVEARNRAERNRRIAPRSARPDRAGRLARSALASARKRKRTAHSAGFVASPPTRPSLTREDGKIDWSEPAEVIERKIRAFDPWPGAFTHLADAAGTRAQVENLPRESGRDCKDAPGEILRSDESIVIAPNDGALSLGEVQLEGKRRMSAAEFLRGHRSERCSLDWKARGWALSLDVLCAVFPPQRPHF